MILCVYVCTYYGVCIQKPYVFKQQIYICRYMQNIIPYYYRYESYNHNNNMILPPTSDAYKFYV